MNEKLILTGGVMKHFEIDDSDATGFPTPMRPADWQVAR